MFVQKETIYNLRYDQSMQYEPTSFLTMTYGYHSDIPRGKAMESLSLSSKTFHGPQPIQNID